MNNQFAFFDFWSLLTGCLGIRSYELNQLQSTNDDLMKATNKQTKLILKKFDKKIKIIEEKQDRILDILERLEQHYGI